MGLTGLYKYTAHSLKLAWNYHFQSQPNQNVKIEHNTKK